MALKSEWPPDARSLPVLEEKPDARKTEGKKKGGGRGWQLDGISDSLRTWVWANSRDNEGQEAYMPQSMGLKESGTT